MSTTISQSWWQSNKKGAQRAKQKMLKSQRKRQRKYWEEMNKKPPKYKPELIINN